MTAADQIAFEQIYRLALKHSGGVERKIRRICEAVLGTRAAVVKADFIATKPQENDHPPLIIRHSSLITKP